MSPSGRASRRAHAGGPGRTCAHAHSPALDEPVPDLVLELLLQVRALHRLEVSLDGNHGFLVVLLVLDLHLVPQAGHLFGLDDCGADFIEQRRWVLER